MALQLVRLAAVLALLTAAAALATPPGRLPLALRGLLAVLRRDGGNAAGTEKRTVSARRRCMALLLVLLAAGLALI